MDISGARFLAVILKEHNANFACNPSYSLPIWGKTMLDWVSEAFEGYPKEFLEYSKEQSIRKLISKYDDGSVKYLAVVYSDMPLLTAESIAEAVETIEQNNLDILRLARGFIVRSSKLDLVDRLNSQKKFFFSAEEDFITANDYKQVALIADIMRNRILSKHMAAGVYIIDPGNTYIDGTVKIEPGVVIYPGNHLRGNTVIHSGAILYEGNTITDSIIEQGAEVISSKIVGSTVGRSSHIGPYAYIRPGSVVGKGCKIGDFVELKAAVIGDGTKASHLSYLGDCTVGSNCNIGCGVVFCNYDGKKKHKTIVGNNVFIGSNSNLVAPVVVEDNAFVAAGSTITQDVEAYALAIARAKQINKPDWNKKNSEDK